MDRGSCKVIPEKWSINRDEKTNLCNWLCENGTAKDFESFKELFDLLANALDVEVASSKSIGS